MRGEIIDEEDGWIGVKVEDNNGISHKIAVEFDGEIRGHGQEGYPDKATERTPQANEHVEQARRYARYYVERERGYETIEWRHDPVRLASAARAVAALEPDEVQEYFGDLFDQVRSHSEDVDRPVTLPDGVRPGHVNYQQDVYLGIEPAALGELNALEAHFDGPVPVEESADSMEDELAALIRAADEADEFDATDLTIEAVSGVHVRWDDEAGQYHHERTGVPDLDRNPDARLDILPFAPGDIEEFQAQLARNLLCQARDAYVGMGVAPPERFRITGLGRHQIATLYAQFDFYQPYHDPDADIDWEAIEPEPATVE